MPATSPPTIAPATSTAPTEIHQRMAPSRPFTRMVTPKTRREKPKHAIVVHIRSNRGVSAKPVAARVEREHQWPAETVLSEGHRLVGALASLSEQSGSSAQRTAT